ncbi:MAG: hypothetical protein ACE5J9_01525 [Methanosarcinales archaeon]
MNALYPFTPLLRFYYLDFAIDNSKIIDLLKKIEQKHGIPYECLNVIEINQKEHYKKYFAASGRARVLRHRTGKRVKTTFRFQNGRGEVYLAPTIVVLESDVVEYFAKGIKEGVNFLNILLKEGKSFLKRIYISKEDIQFKIIEKFKKSKILKGVFEVEVPVNKKFIDIVCKTQSCDWILEVKKELNMESLGQVLVYKFMYSKENPEKKVKAGIVCLKSDPDIYEVCTEYKVKVFVLED